MKTVNLKFHNGQNRKLLEAAGYRFREGVGDFLRYTVHPKLGRGRFHLVKKSGKSENIFTCHFDRFTGKKTHTSHAGEDIVGPETDRIRAVLSRCFDRDRYEIWRTVREFSRTAVPFFLPSSGKRESVMENGKRIRSGSQAYRDFTRRVSYYETLLQRELGGELTDHTEQARKMASEHESVTVDNSFDTETSRA